MLLAVLSMCLYPAAAAEWTIPESHPRLLINRDELASLRVRCGIEGYGEDKVAKDRGLRFGSQRAMLTRLHAVAGEIMLAHARPGDLFVPAVLHLINGELDQPDEYTKYIISELLDTNRRRFELDALIALDWSWDAVEPDKRSRIANRVMHLIQPLQIGESPLNHLAFYPKISSLAAAIVLYDSRPTSKKPKVADKLDDILTAAKNYLEGPFVPFCKQRGAMPTSGENGIWSEADITCVVEIWRSGMGKNLWPELTDSIERSMEHYFYADTSYAGLDHGFIHDDGNYIPSRPGQTFRGFVPAVPWAIARNTRNPIATWFANRSFTAVKPEPDVSVDRYLWVPLIYGPLDQPEAARRACPLGRNFGGGWIVMRSGFVGGDTVVLFDAGQPFWRSRQHYDAGQFQIYRKGQLAIDSGSDVTHEAVAFKDGKTTIAGKRGDWDQYFQATIAHNCVTVADRRHIMHVYGRPWLAMGNQRLIEHDYDLSTGDVAQTNRITGKLIAFETNSFYSYAAADLSAAYPSELVRSIRRRILLVNDGAVLVLDQVQATEADSMKTWHLQLPARPQVNRSSLSAARQVHGLDDKAGIWSLLPEQTWLDVSDQDGRLFVRTLLPADAQRRVVGGPMKPRTIPAGPMAGETYFGGEPFGYEHRLWPASIPQAPNAAYELGNPTNLGAHFAASATWGRLDVYPEQPTDQVTFCHLLIPTDRKVANPPEVRFEIRNNRVNVELKLADKLVSIELAIDESIAGKVSFRDPKTAKVIFEQSLVEVVQPDADIPAISGFIP